MKTGSLNAVINAMAAQIESCHREEEGPVFPGLMSEIEAYMSVDAVLTALYKQYLDIKRSRLSVLEKHGAGSAMADVAGDQEDSARSAMETRLIELCGHAQTRHAAEQAMAQYETDLARAGEEKSKSLLAHARKMAEAHARRKAETPPESRDGRADFMTALLLMNAGRRMLRQANIKLTLASRFMVACDARYSRAAA